MSNWYALYVKPNKEKTVEQLLSQRCFETFSPSILERRLWSDRIKTIERALFPGYVFCRFNPVGEERMPVLTVPGVHWIVGNGREAVPEPQVDALRRALQSGSRVEPHEFLQVGDRVRVLAGPLAGVEGIVKGSVQHQATVQLILSVELLRRSVSVEVPGDAVAPLQDRRLGQIASELSALAATAAVTV
jgi:transcription termination/antitermination protein NusG